MDVSSVCRLCCRVQKKFDLTRNIFVGTSNAFSVSETIENLFQLKLEKSPGLPFMSCRKCNSFLDSIMTFRDDVFQSQCTLEDTRDPTSDAGGSEAEGTDPLSTHWEFFTDSEDIKPSQPMNDSMFSDLSPSVPKAKPAKRKILDESLTPISTNQRANEYDENNPNQCKTCLRIYPSEKDLAVHTNQLVKCRPLMRDPTTGKLKPKSAPAQCPKCKKVLCSTAAVNRHVMNDHCWKVFGKKGQKGPAIPPANTDSTT